MKDSNRLEYEKPIIMNLLKKSMEITEVSQLAWYDDRQVKIIYHSPHRSPVHQRQR